MPKRLLLIPFLFAVTVQAAPRRRTVVPTAIPPCSIVTGTPAVTFTRDAGRTLASIAERLEGVGYTYGLAALDAPGTLLSWHKLTLSRSTDHGCTWVPAATLPSVEFPPSIAAAPGGRAYIWSDNRQFLARFDERGFRSLKAPGTILGIGVDATDGEHLRAGTAEGPIWDSTDGGESWNAVGEVRSDLPYRFAFDPRDLDHIVFGGAGLGASVTRDGGRSWTPSNIADGFNAFQAVFSPADPSVVWLMALETEKSDEPPAFGRHIYRSIDGGTTFHAAVDQAPGVQLINGPLLAPDPLDPAVLYFVFGTYYQGYGTDLFRYDATSGALTVTHNAYHGIDAIAFSRTDPRVMYLGLANEDLTAPVSGTDR